MFAAGSAAAATAQGPRVPASHASMPGGRMIRPAGTVPMAARGGVKTTVGSTNWSGYAATGGPFTTVSANWVEPAGTCTGGHKYSSFWVGLDGYSSSTVEQTGSEVDCSGRTAVYYSWYEMYPAFPVNFSNTVRPGDHFTGSVAFTGGSNFTLKLADTTRGWSHTVNASLSGAARSSAEVIVEAPSSSSGVLPLADFGTVHITGSTVNGSPIGNFNPTEIIMVNNSGQEKDTVSPLTSGQNFSATWLRSN
jgi:hypothetical protein